MFIGTPCFELFNKPVKEKLGSFGSSCLDKFGLTGSGVKRSVTPEIKKVTPIVVKADAIDTPKTVAVKMPPIAAAASSSS